MQAKTGVLFYHLRPQQDSATISEHIHSFFNLSENEIHGFNTFHSPSSYFLGRKFDFIVLHYSLFGTYPFFLSSDLRTYISNSRAVKIFFFQDEHQFHLQRIDLLNKLGVDQIYSCLEQIYFDEIYSQHLQNKIQLFESLTGYVNPEYKNNIEALSNKSYVERKYDIGYRSRKLSLKCGKGSQEKYKIGEFFLHSSEFSNLKKDISSDDKDRIYANNWLEFLGNCKFTLGAESGVSVFDVSGKIYRGYDDLIAKGLTDEEAYKQSIEKYEKNINYRAISPRIFEAAATKTCQILLEGKYNNILEADKHYISIKNDFSNYKAIINKMKDQEFVNYLTQNCLSDLILSDKYSYSTFIKGFDLNLAMITNNQDKIAVAPFRKTKKYQNKTLKIFIYKLRNSNFLFKKNIKSALIFLQNKANK